MAVDAGQIVRVLDLLPLLLRVDVVDHAQVDVVGLQAGQQVLKGGADVGHVAGAVILAAFPCGADVPLNVPLIAVFVDTLADDVAGLGVSHPAIQDVDALGGCVLDQRDAFFFGVALQPLAAKADLADLQVCLAQSAGFHKVCLLLICVAPFICSRFYALPSMAWTSSTTNSWVGTGILWRCPASTTAPLMTSTSVRRPAFRSA